MRDGARRGGRFTLLGAALATSLVAAACGNAAQGQASGGSSAPGVTATAVDVGSLSTASGPLAAGFGEITDGVQAYFDMVNAQGGVHGRKLVLAHQGDDQGNPTVDGDVARTLVAQDHVFAIVGVATPFFNGSSYLRQQGTPTFGEVISTDWEGAPNLFGVGGSALDVTTIGPVIAFAAKQLGATAAAVVAYPVPQSAQACSAVADAMRAAGIAVPVEDVSFPIGGNPVPDVVQMQSHHVDLLVSCMEAPDSLSFARAMHQYGISGAHSIWLTGYDRQTIADNAALTEGLVLPLQHVPFEAAAAFPGRYPGMAQYLQEMRRYEPRWVYDETALQGWLAAAQFVAGLQAAGPDPTQQKVIAAVNAERSFTAAGLMTPVDWSNAHTSTAPPYCDAFVEVHDGTPAPAFILHPGQVYDCFGRGSATPIASPPGTPGT